MIRAEFVFIVGASGAGKSTFLKLIMHEETPTSGKIVINDTDVTKLRRSKVPYIRRHMGIVFQDFRLIDKMNVSTMLRLRCVLSENLRQ